VKVGIGVIVACRVRRVWRFKMPRSHEVEEGDLLEPAHE